MSILPVIIILLVIGGAVAFVLLKRKKASTGGVTGSTGPPATCGNSGQQCIQGKCCNPNDSCIVGICSAKSTPPIPSFLLQTATGCLNSADQGIPIATAGQCSWTPGIESFWYWDGVNQLIFKTITVDTNGIATGIVNRYINSGQPGYVTIDSELSTGVNFVRSGSQYALYSIDYSLCASLDQTGHLIWQSCLGYPTLFTVVIPSGCEPVGAVCSHDGDCCPPYNSCVSGKCSSCIGSPEQFQSVKCPTSDNYVICDTGTSEYSCQSKCGTSATCQPNQLPECQLQTDGSYQSVCVYQCTADQPACEDHTQAPICQNTGGTWEWVCPFDPCSQEEKDQHPISQAPPYQTGWTWNTDHYEPPDGSSPWQYPMWDCVNQKWTYYPGCNKTYKQTCGNGQVAVCGNDQSYQWSCADPTTTDFCGLTATTGSCGPDATCMDIAKCNGQDGTVSSDSASDWRWICPSHASRCEALEIMSWYPENPIPQYGSSTQVSIIHKDVNTPVYPSVNNNYCRSQGGSDSSRPAYSLLIDNPTGNELFSGGQYPSLFMPPPSDIDGHSEYIFTSFGSQWNCVSENPCYPNGTFEIGGNEYSTIMGITPPPGNEGPPSQGELLAQGTCSCKPGFAGPTCALDDSMCHNQGTIQACNSPGGKCVLPDGYSCQCKPGFYGLHCQFTTNDCNLAGTPDDQSDTLSCICGSTATGSTCQNCSTQIGSIASERMSGYFVTYNGQYAYIDSNNAIGWRDTPGMIVAKIMGGYFILGADGQMSNQMLVASGPYVGGHCDYEWDCPCDPYDSNSARPPCFDPSTTYPLVIKTSTPVGDSNHTNIWYGAILSTNCSTSGYKICFNTYDDTSCGPQQVTTVAGLVWSYDAQYGMALKPPSSAQPVILKPAIV